MKNNIPTITVDPELRELILPSEKLVLGINGDVEVNAVQFQLPLTYRELELKKLTPRINYVNPNGDTNYYETVMESDESNCYFIWPITPDITAYTGHVRFSLTLYQTEEGTILHKFNTRSATGRVYTGFEAEKHVTPEQQLTLLSKLETQIKADLTEHTEKLKGELTEKGKEILDGFGESGSVSEELKTIKQDLDTKLTAPPTPEVGKILKIRSVNEDGTFVCEWADDGGSNLDVRIDGKSIVQDGVAEIPISSHDTLGLVYTDNSAGGYTTGLMNQQGRLKVNTASIDDVNKRRLRKEIDCSNFDYAVKAAMCDGKGAAWTVEEQAAARERMGTYRRDYRLIADITLEQESSRLIVEKDADGKDISLRKAKIFVFSPVPRENSKNNGYVQLNDKGIYYGAIDWKVNEKNSVTVVNIDIFGEIAPTTVKFTPAHNIGIASTKNISMSIGNKLDYNNEINKIIILANYYFDTGTRFIIMGKE